MLVQPLNQRQIFGMKRESLQKKVELFYQETQDAAAITEYAIAVMIRNSLVVGDFSLLFTELIREIYLHTEPTDMLRRFCPLFEHYFDQSEWTQVKHRLFGNSKMYHKLNEILGFYKNYLQEKTTPLESLDGQQYKIISVFEDANSKLHTWNLGDADPKIATEKADAVLNLLTMLTIFRKAGVRKFVKVEKSDIVNCTRRALIAKKNGQEELESVELTNQEIIDKLQAFFPENREALGKNDPTFGAVDEEKEENTQEFIKAGHNTESRKFREDGGASEGRSDYRTIAVIDETKSSTAKKTSLALTAYERDKTVYTKPKSKKQKDIERKEKILKDTPYGRKKKPNSRKKRNRK